MRTTPAVASIVRRTRGRLIQVLTRAMKRVNVDIQMTPSTQ
jgi:hypothetical protein